MKTKLCALLWFISINAVFAQTMLIKQIGGTYLEISYDNTVEISFLVNTPCTETPTVIYEGKTYNTVQIGGQCWLKENLNVGTRINLSSDQANNVILEKYCYENNEAYCTTYGGLYHWNEAMQYVTTQGTKGICPTGWHIPTKTEFELLKTAVINDGNKLKKEDQGTGSGIGTNKSGFSGLLAGIVSDPYFSNLSEDTNFWSSNQSSFQAYSLYLIYNEGIIKLNINPKSSGCSVRCVKD